MALGAGAKGVMDHISAKDDEEEQRKAAMRGLTNRFLSGGNMLQLPEPVEKAPGLEESVGGALMGAGIGQLARGKEKEEVPWYKAAARGYLGK